MVEIIKSNIITAAHGFSTRRGGVSSGIYDSLNLGMNRGDEEDLVIANWDKFLRASGIDSDNKYDFGKIPFVCGNQVHGSKVAIVTSDDARPAYGKYSEDYIKEQKAKNVALSPDNLIEADGYVTNVPNLAIAIFTADCTPVIMEDPVNKVVAAVHCGWRSTAADIMKEAVDAMLSLKADRNEIRVAIGPAICKDCFEVGIEVIEAMQKLLGNSIDNLYTNSPSNVDKYMLNLKAVVKERFLQIGIHEKHIEDVNECTMCQPSKYWSHRITGLNRGSQANVIMIK